MAAMMLSASAVMTPTVRGISSRRAASPGRVIARPVVRPSRGREVTHRVRATVSKDNVFANSPGTLSGLGDITKAPLMPDDAATMPHRERLKVFSGSAHPELSDVRTNAPRTRARPPSPPPSACPRPRPPSTVQRDARVRPSTPCSPRRSRAARAILPGSRAGDPPRRVRFKLFPHLSVVVVVSADPSSSLLTSPIRIEPAGDRQLPRHGAWRSRDQEVRGR